VWPQKPTAIVAWQTFRKASFGSLWEFSFPSDVAKRDVAIPGPQECVDGFCRIFSLCADVSKYNIAPVCHCSERYNGSVARPLLTAPAYDW
jgi:hypothetical protein